MEILTFGCSANQADSEIMAGLLRENGLESADVTVVNTCTVKSPTENKILRLLRRLRGEGVRVVVAGCIPAARPNIVEEFPEFSFIGVNSQNVVDAVRAASEGRRLVRIEAAKDKSCLPRRRINPAVGILPIAEGCVGACSFCQTRFARGVLRSFPLERLVHEAEDMLASGVREIWVTAQDTGAYGLDTGTRLPNLLEEIASLDGEFMVRVGMMNPDNALTMLDELVDAYACDKIYRFLHLPLQSGDDRVLADMNRRYTVADFMEVADAFARLGTTLSTDVILGYPTEDETAFQNTVKAVRDVKPDVLNATRYWARPGTAAVKLKQLPGKETKRRSRIINQVFRKIGLDRNSRWVGWVGDVLITEANRDGTYTARNRWYKPIIINAGRLGGNAKIRVEGCTHYDLRGRII